MSSRTPLVLGLFGLAAITGAIVWFTQVRSTATTTTVPASASQTPAPTAAVALDHELSKPEKTERTAPVSEVRPAASDRRPAADPKKQSPQAVVPPAVARPGVIEIAVPQPPTPGTEQPKLPSLGPIMGGAAAIKGKYFGSTYAERLERADLLEAALGGEGAQDKDQIEIVKALKEELVWLRENMGTPPTEPPK